jgi:hypothetical protein
MRKASSYGPDANMVDLRLTLAAGCPKIAAGKIMDLCGVYYLTGSDDKRPPREPGDGFRDVLWTAASPSPLLQGSRQVGRTMCAFPCLGNGQML